MEQFFVDLKNKWDTVLHPLRNLIDSVKPFVDVFKSIMDALKGIKFGYKTLKET